MLAAGGLWWAPAFADPDEVISEAHTLGVKALEIQSPDISLLEELPQLEYLTVTDVHDPGPIHRLENLRGLHVSGTWHGRIDFQRLPRLEWFSVVECPPDEGGLDSLYVGHASIRHLAVQRYRHADLTQLRDLKLETLYIGYSRTLTSLDGVEAIGSTLWGLGLYGCSNLATLDGISALPGLVSLELGSLRRITELDFARELPRLRHLDAFDLANVESLGPLADHDALEFVSFGRVRDLDLEPLTRLPRLKLFLTGHYRWNRDIHSLPYAHDLPEDHPAVAEWRSLQL